MNITTDAGNGGPWEWRPDTVTKSKIELAVLIGITVAKKVVDILLGVNRRSFVSFTKMDLSAVEDGAIVHPSTDQSSVRSALHPPDPAWHDSIGDQGEDDSDLRIHIQSACSIDMNVFEQMNTSSGKETAAAAGAAGNCKESSAAAARAIEGKGTIGGKLADTGSCNFSESIFTAATEAVISTSSCAVVAAETVMERNPGVVSGNSNRVTMTEGKQAATLISGCDVSIEDVKKETFRAVDSTSTTAVTEGEEKAGELAYAVDSVSTSRTRDLNDTDVDCRPTCNAFPECDSTQEPELSVYQPPSKEAAAGTRHVDEQSDRALGLKDECNSSGRSPPAKRAKISEHSVAEISAVVAPLGARLVEVAPCVSSGVRPLAHASESRGADATEGSDRAKVVTCAGAGSVSVNTDGETSENTVISSLSGYSSRSNVGPASGKTDPKLPEEQKSRASVANSSTKTNDREVRQHSEICADDVSKMDVGESAADPRTIVDSSSTKDPPSKWNPSTIPTLQARGNNNSHAENRKPLKPCRFPPPAKQSLIGTWGNARQRGWQGAPSQGPPSKRPTLGDIVAEAEHNKKRVPMLMELDGGGSDFYHRRDGDQQIPWNNGPEHRPPFSDQQWKSNPSPGYTSPFDKGMPPRQGPPPLSQPPPGMLPQGMPHPGIPSQGMPPQGMPPQGMSPQGMPPQGMSPQGMPPQGMPPQGMPPQGMPPPGMPPQGMPPQGMPPQGMPPQGMPPQGMPSQGMPPPGMPPQGMPPPGMPPQGMPPQGMPPQGMPPQGMPVQQPGMLMPPPGNMPMPLPGSMPGPPHGGGMFMPPPLLVGMDPSSSMPWNAGMPPPSNSMPQPFNMAPPGFMPPPNVPPPGCMAPPGGSVPPIFGMPPAGMFPPQQFPPPVVNAATPYFGQYQGYEAAPPPGNYPGTSDQSYTEWNEWRQQYAQWLQQCNAMTTAQTRTSEAPVATSTMLPTSDTTPLSTSKSHGPATTTLTSKGKGTQAEKEALASISLPPVKQKLNWIEAKPPKPTSHNRLPNLTSLVSEFNQKSIKGRASPTKEADPKDPGSSENSMLWIGNLPVGTRAVELRSTISEYGRVCNCKVGALKSQKDAGLFALVTMETAEDAEYCIQRLNNSTYRGQSIIVRKFHKD